MINDYYALIKPGIVYGNSFTALAGFLYAAHGAVRVGLLAAMLVGLALIVASACAVNNYLDRDIDARMERTKARALVNTRITPTRALLFATILGVLGAALLVLYTNLLTFSVALCGFVVYVALYTPLKRISEHAVLIGALAGATPPVVGYVAVANSLDAASLLLFMILIAWQMVHFLAIALYREDEYRAAQVPVFPIRQGAVATKALMTVYVFIFAFGAWALPYVGGQLGLFYRAGVGALALFWLALSIYGFYAVDERSWARLNFFYSLVVIVGFSVMLAMQ